ncbi:signal peptidase I [Ammoniphilus sp. 3BR4]|uniref:signal peptidase I n=1 Tax=Ammoniphilus sp. 3BR4 TaxID=3158265 RepID=UPI00346759D7
MFLTGDFGLVTVPKGHLFVMEDNRHHSMDSRMIGTISKEQIIGRVDAGFWPF